MEGTLSPEKGIEGPVRRRALEEEGTRTEEDRSKRTRRERGLCGHEDPPTPRDGGRVLNSL